MSDVPENMGGRLAANFRRANLAEGLAIQMFRPFAAVAPVPREEDHGVDLICTLLKKHGNVLSAENSFLVQVKTSSAANFGFHGEGVDWLKQLKLPYFPVIFDLEAATLRLYSLDKWRFVIFSSVIRNYNFTLEPDGLHDFLLSKPLMTWSLSDCVHPDFPRWAYSVLKPTLTHEEEAQQTARTARFRTLEGRDYRFADRGADGAAESPPNSGQVFQHVTFDEGTIYRRLEDALGPFARWISNRPMQQEGDDVRLLALRDAFRCLDFDPDQHNEWEEIAAEMRSDEG